MSIASVTISPLNPSSRCKTPVTMADDNDEGTERERSAALDRAAAVAPEASPLGGAVGARRAAQAARARAALDAALATATKEGVEAGRALLVAAVAQFEGTQYHADLVRVRDHLTRFGAFPVLEIRK